MAKKIKKGSKAYYLCEECNFAYKDRKIAAKCEAWCKKYHSCNTELTKYAVDITKKQKIY